MRLVRMLMNGIGAPGLVVCLAVWLGCPGLAYAQLPEPGLRFFETPFGYNVRDPGRLFAPFGRSLRGNRSVINGTSSLGSQSVSALGNAISVEIEGSGNTVVITADQVNNGDQNASLVLNGELDLE